MQLRDEVRACMEGCSSMADIYNRIIEPLASRCSKFRFTPLDSESSSLRLSHIAQQENIPISKPVIDALISTSSGDLRRAITYLQSASRLSSSTIPATPIQPLDIQEIAGVVPDSVIQNFARVLGIEIDEGMDVDESSQQKASGFEPIRNQVKFLMREGYSAGQIISQVGLQPLLYDSIQTCISSCMTWLFSIRP